MSLSLPSPSPQYDPENEAQTRAALEREDIRNAKMGGFASAFSAYLSADTANNKTGDGTAYTILCDVEQFDVGKNYDPSTGLFTAPGAGVYHFAAGVVAANIGAAHTAWNVSFVASVGKTYRSGYINPFAAGIGGNAGLSVEATMQLAAGETVALQVTVANGAKTVGVFSATPGGVIVTYFSGHLVPRL